MATGGERVKREVAWANLLSWSVAVVALVWALVHFRSIGWTPLRVIGLVICGVAFGLVSVARYQLGRSFSVTPQARRLVTHGLYARIRNPIYVFAELFIAGFGLVLMSWKPIVLMLALGVMQAMRARKEAAVLEAAFGEEYVAYRRRTWF